jgi:hypothetical protein
MAAPIWKPTYPGATNSWVWQVAPAPRYGEFRIVKWNEEERPFILVYSPWKWLRSGKYVPDTKFALHAQYDTFEEAQEAAYAYLGPAVLLSLMAEAKKNPRRKTLLRWGRPTSRPSITGEILTWLLIHDGRRYDLSLHLGSLAEMEFSRLMVFGDDGRRIGMERVDRLVTPEETKLWAEDLILTPAEKLVLTVTKTKTKTNPMKHPRRKPKAKIPWVRRRASLRGRFRFDWGVYTVFSAMPEFNLYFDLFDQHTFRGSFETLAEAEAFVIARLTPAEQLAVLSREKTKKNPTDRKPPAFRARTARTIEDARRVYNDLGRGLGEERDRAWRASAVTVRRQLEDLWGSAIRDGQVFVSHHATIQPPIHGNVQGPQITYIVQKPGSTKVSGVFNTLEQAAARSVDLALMGAKTPKDAKNVIEAHERVLEQGTKPAVESVRRRLRRIRS